MKPIYFFPILLVVLLAFAAIFHYALKPWQHTADKVVDGFVPGVGASTESAQETLEKVKSELSQEKGQSSSSK